MFRSVGRSLAGGAAAFGLLFCGLPSFTQGGFAEGTGEAVHAVSAEVDTADAEALVPEPGGKVVRDFS